MLLFCSCFTRVLSSSRTGRYLTQRFRPQGFPKWRLTLAPCDKHISRRVALHSMVVVTAFLFSSPVQSRIDGPELRGLDAPVDEQPPPFLNIGKGLSAQEVATGTGTRCVEDGSTVSVKYVMRRSNGYFIDASYGFDRFETYNFRAGSTQVVEGFDIALHGMRVGGRRRFILPPQLGYMKGTGKNDPGPIPPDFGARRSLAAHAKEPLIFEVQVVRIRPPSGESSS